jgi:hypothetical protein
MPVPTYSTPIAFLDEIPLAVAYHLVEAGSVIGQSIWICEKNLGGPNYAAIHVTISSYVSPISGGFDLVFGANCGATDTSHQYILQW